MLLRSYRGWRDSLLGGIILIVLGGLFLAQNFFNFDAFGKFWPVLLIILGLGVVITHSKKSSN